LKSRHPGFRPVGDYTPEGGSRGPDIVPVNAGNQFHIPGFRLESIPHLMRDRNDVTRVSASFYDFIKIMAQEKILVSDFDGTMTERDFFRLALERLPQAAASFWERYEQGEITHFQALASIFAELRCPEKEMDALIFKMEPDQGILSACNRLKTQGWRLVIASAGCAWYIERILAPLGIEAEIHANPGRFSEQQGLIMELPLASPYFCRETGIDKTRLVQAALDHSVVAFAGDGRPDLGAALLVHPSIRFAKGRLAEELTKRGEVFTRFQSWSEMVEKLLAAKV
jgi:2-hydroxy-3-keto-5-methylthiopentenyl-1-phosphate phosphatase